MTQNPAKQLRSLLEKPGVVLGPGVTDPFTARLVKEAGFDMVYMGGNATTAVRLGTPDVGLLTVAEMADQAARITAGGRLRMHLFREAEAILVQDAFPVMPIYFYVVSGLVSPRVSGFYWELTDQDGNKSANLQDIHPIRGMSIAAPVDGGPR